jgi:proline iminopeptidase
VNQPAYDIKDQLRRISCPVLITVGRHDWITPVEASERIASLVRDSRLVVFENSGHSPQIEEADLWLSTVADFLREVGADQTASV